MQKICCSSRLVTIFSLNTTIGIFSMLNSPSRKTNDHTVVDVLIICALKDEYDQILNVTDGLISPSWVITKDHNGRIIAEAAFLNATEQPLTVRATWASNMGREQAIAVASSLIQSQKVRCIAMSGICGGRRGKVALGDVIFANRLWSYDTGKLTNENGEQKLEGDSLQYHPSDLWEQRMQNLKVSPDKWPIARVSLPLEHQEDWVLSKLLLGEDPVQNVDFVNKCPDWSNVLQRLWKKGLVDKPTTLSATGKDYISEIVLLNPKGLPPVKDFKVHVAPIATGAAVVEDESLFPKLSKSMRKVLGVDMEASALGAFGNIHGVPVIVAKAVSDFGDIYKDDRYREFAAQASAQCLIKLLREASDLLPNRSDNNQTVDKKITNHLVFTESDLIAVLAEEYPDIRDARAVWVRAGGKNADVESISRPTDMWQKIWLRCKQGAHVTPKALLTAILSDLPENKVLLQQMALL